MFIQQAAEAVADSGTNAVNTIGNFPHKVVNWVSAAGVWFGGLLVAITDPSVLSSLPAVFNLLPAKTPLHYFGIFLIAAGPLISAIRGYRPR